MTDEENQGRKWPPDDFENFGEDEEQTSSPSDEQIPEQGKKSPGQTPQESDSGKPSFFDFAASQDPVSKKAEEENKEEAESRKSIFEESASSEEPEKPEEDKSSPDPEEEMSFPWDEAAGEEAEKSSSEETTQDPEPICEEETKRKEKEEKLDAQEADEDAKYKPKKLEETKAEEPLSEIEEPRETPPIEPPQEQDLAALFGTNGHSSPEESSEETEEKPVFEESTEEQETLEEKPSLETRYQAEKIEETEKKADEEQRSRLLEEDPNQYRAYAKYDFLAQDLVEEKKPGIKLNTQAIVLILAVISVGGWYGYSQFFGKRYDYSSKRKAKRRVKEPHQKDIFGEKEELPTWGITYPKRKDWTAEGKTIRAARVNSGRDNPFAIPEAVLEVIKKDIEAKLAKEKDPEIFQKYVYRATLVGVIASNKRTLALVNLRTAKFDVKEGTEKEKILKEATKAINREKDEALELISGDVFGPSWNITTINDGRSDGAEASIIISRGEEEELILQLGVPTELGIYDDKGEIDTFKEDVKEEKPEEEIASEKDKKETSEKKS